MDTDETLPLPATVEDLRVEMGLRLLDMIFQSEVGTDAPDDVKRSAPRHQLTAAANLWISQHEAGFTALAVAAERALRTEDHDRRLDSFHSDILTGNARGALEVMEGLGDKYLMRLLLAALRGSEDDFRQLMELFGALKPVTG
ncbi:hypothetical protein JNJ66_06030 [Candidatus Saccharibacteria bacterium]|nr:hypothetical protein [Candidatus Saccharibacteria bacterium]